MQPNLGDVDPQQLSRHIIVTDSDLAASESQNSFTVVQADSAPAESKKKEESSKDGKDHKTAATGEVPRIGRYRVK